MSPASTSGAVASRPPGEPPDQLFALVAGLYAGLVSVPLAVGLAAPVLDGPGTLYVALLTGITVVTVGVALGARRWHGGPERLGASRRRWLLPGVPVVLGGGGLLGREVAPGVVTDGFVPFALLTVVLGTSGGLVLSMMATTRYARAVVGASETEATWRAGWPRGRRRLALGAGIALLAVGLGSLLADVALAAGPLSLLWHGVVPLGAVVATLGQEREYRATSVGLERSYPANRRFDRWESFAGYEVTDTAVVVRYRARWRLPVYCDRSDVDDVIGVLDDHLDRL